MAEPVGIVLGSGLGPLAERVVVSKTVGFAEAGLPVSSVKGHAGRFLFGTLGGREVIVMQGRVHLYEGHDAKAITAALKPASSLPTAMALRRGSGRRSRDTGSIAIPSGTGF